MTEITYTRNGDYFIPDIVLKEKEHKPLGKYSRMRKRLSQKSPTRTLEQIPFKRHTR